MLKGQEDSKCALWLVDEIVGVFQSPARSKGGEGGGCEPLSWWWDEDGF